MTHEKNDAATKFLLDGMQDMYEKFYGLRVSITFWQTKPIDTTALGKAIKRSIADAGFDEIQLSHLSYRSLSVHYSSSP